MLTKVVVTGGAGFIGSHLVRELVSQGYAVSVIDDLSAGKRTNLADVHCELVVADILDHEALYEVCAGATYIFHLAARPRVQYSIKHPLETHDINVRGTLGVLQAARHAKVSRVMFASSNSVYGEQLTLPYREDMVPNPLSPYALEKWEGERWCAMYGRWYGVNTVCLRFFNVYGPGFDPVGEYALVIGKFLTQRKEGKRLTITGDGKQTRDFTHVSDVVRACVVAGRLNYVPDDCIINIGAGQPTSINHIATLIGGPGWHREYITTRQEPRRSKADITRAYDMLGWKPEISIEQGIAELKAQMGIV